MTSTNAARLFSVFAVWFASCLIITNILNTKIFQLGQFAFPAGIVTFPITFVISDLGTELLGYSAWRRAIWLGFGALIFMVVAFEIGRLLPSASFWQGQAAYETTLQQLPRIAAASLLAYLAGEFTNSAVLAKMKVRMQGRGMAARFIASTAVGQAVDSVVFMTVAFAGVYPTSQMTTLIFSAWAFKVVWEIMALPVSIPLANRLKRRHGLDALDSGTTFNPFSLQS
jgi:queuosine precursor transporter